jgi:hypothetical protein
MLKDLYIFMKNASFIYSEMCVLWISIFTATKI